jgi:hypothetical protein
MGVAFSSQQVGASSSEEEETTMNPAAIPGLPATIFPALFSTAVPFVGADVVDITAAVAAIAWGLGGLIALRIAIAMSRDDERSDSTPASSPKDPHPRHGFRDAA